MSAGFDLLVAVTLLWSAYRALTTPDLARAIVMFIVFGLLMTLAWARLDAPDIALAEAAIGAGLTGALLLDALGALRGQVAATRPAWLLRVMAVAAALALAGIFIFALLDLPFAERPLPAMVDAHMGISGVEHPVTAVLLNYRGYDTLLEIAVLLLALLGMLAVTPVAGRAASATPNPVLRTFASVATPLSIIAAGYLLWAGAHRPGGAFQAGAVLAAAAVLLHLSGRLPAWASPGWLLRAGLSAGFLIFLGAGLAMLGEGALLRYPIASAGTWIIVIEAGLTLSLGLTLAGLFLVMAQRSQKT